MEERAGFGTVCPTALVMSVADTIETTQHLGEHLLEYNIENLVDISGDLVADFESSDLQ